MIWTRSSKGQAEGDVYSLVKGMELKRDQTLVVVHAEHGVPFTIPRMMKNCVRGERPVENRGCRISDRGLQLSNGRYDDVDFFAAKHAGFAGVRIQAGNRDTRSGDPTAAKKVVEQQTDADDLLRCQRGRHITKREVDGNESHGQFPARKEHCEILDSATVGKKFCLPGKLETDPVHAGFVNWSGYNGIDFAAQGQPRRLFQRIPGGSSRFGGGLA